MQCSLLTFLVFQCITIQYNKVKVMQCSEVQSSVFTALLFTAQKNCNNMYYMNCNCTVLKYIKFLLEKYKSSKVQE